jgi:predicted DNA-binding transcriptional regulator YafY
MTGDAMETNMPTTTDTEDNIPAIVERLVLLRDLLCQGPQRPRDIPQYIAHYLAGDSGRRQLRRDLSYLEVMGYQVVRLQNPLRLSLTGGPQVLDDDEVDTLTHIRETFTQDHPLSPMIQQLLTRLTTQLPAPQRTRWQRRPALRVLLAPAIDYSPYGPLLRWLDTAIVERAQIAFWYRARGKQSPTWHERLDPYDLEYTDRHFFLVAYSYTTGSVLTFRLDRIVEDPAQRSPERLPSRQRPRREPRMIHFTYRLPTLFAEGGVSERFLTQTVRREGDAVFVDAADTSEFRIMRTLLGYGEFAVLVDGPESLMNRMRDVVADMARNYGVVS